MPVVTILWNFSKSNRQQIVEELKAKGFVQIQKLQLTTKIGDNLVVDESLVTLDVNGETHSIAILLDVTETAWLLA